MTGKGTLPGDGPEESASSPIDEDLRAALALLRYAHDCSQDAGTPMWDFALEIGHLYAAGLTITGLRWLVAKGYVEHGRETSNHGDAHRSFAPGGGFMFSAMTCVILTRTGADFARHGREAPAAEGTSDESNPCIKYCANPHPMNESDRDRGPDAGVSPSPHWDPRRRELFLGERMVKQFRVPAKNQEMVLSAFQEDGWPDRIDDPLSGAPDINPKVRLNDAVYRLNHTQTQQLICFHVGASGSSISWSPCEPDRARRPPAAAGESLATA